MVRVPGLETGENQYRFWRFRGRPIDSVICSPLEFRENIDLECKRIVRYHSRFSLAIFEVRAQYENSTPIHRFVRTIHRRLRDTDEIGWYRQGQIGVMMPLTPLEGAWQVAEQISSIFPSFIPLPPFTIHTYPSDDWPKRHRLENFFDYLNIFTIADRLFRLPISKSEEFNSLLDRERGRAHRNGNVFSLIIFRMANLPPGISVQRRMILSLCSRLRDIDEVGWYNDRHLGVLLPYASYQNAQQIAERVCLDLSLPANNETFIIYTYPENWLSDQQSDFALEPDLVVPSEPLTATTPVESSVSCLPIDTVGKR